jgi:hypothetical protein
MIAKLRKFGGRFVKILVNVEHTGERSIAEALEARRRMRHLGEAFVETFTEPYVKATTHGPLENFRVDHLSQHIWFDLHWKKPDMKPGEGFFDERTEEQLVSFFHDQGLDFVRRSYPRSS